ncbi:hypothetical protein E2C01_010464 [Portunus trituberculatus]|uniref:Secreted protein n=1 Tax=Portunus trituberculatus TaxID=210409 RepID=A0A5B7D8F2_PORTR|nr:hypothetical protein [Portunus trituberculatus]
MRIRALLLRWRLFGVAGRGDWTEGRIQQYRGGWRDSHTQAKPDLTHGRRLGHFAAEARHRQVICEESC